MLKRKSSVLRHLLTMQSLDEKKIHGLLDRAEYFLKTVIAKEAVLTTLRGKVIANLFFEPSTRTRNSFSIAEHRLGAIVLSPNMKQSSTLKGELLIDTIRNLEAMGVSLLVIRHPDNHLAQFLSTELKTNIAVVNAGDGSNEHPTQTLLDLMTIRQHFPDFSTLTVAIVGDIAHSRVARSLIMGLHLMKVKKIRIIAPKEFTPENAESMDVDVFHSIDAGLVDADVVYTLRVQKERMEQSRHPKEKQYYQDFGLTQDRLTKAKPNAIVMHPGPMNRGVEIESSVADGSQSVILQQTQNSVAVRMAVIEALLC
ncbi:MAG: aspartate carbamoyltransferase catalytic subunit [Gammaproteobacteria bacterium CG_4_10_14_0_8_um_filter_38_16]|nr:MAG: aspartate carbamoyltransferase catalytic subunit [Gammaproteobacteria bacterium CG_4_10_14_0_8_um_filter_38_16]PJA03219.1 MAG: aspartate carbamoyltransferase catalytic subunit [Gammaproteobacteria bacterium CG_4_10_14_0_2_um_filter_38_22]PJB10909.1 MAG: aspartate carbamoyltransferase catalytic subunit [Gammaproteobacteria bacterium CG_4_9_14_3_um_filter_38_9]